MLLVLINPVTLVTYINNPIQFILFCVLYSVDLNITYVFDAYMNVHLLKKKWMTENTSTEGLFI